MTDTPKPLTRRALIAAFAAAPLAGCAAELGLEPTLPKRRFRAVTIDTSAITAAGYPGWGARLGEALRRAAGPAFADLVDPKDRKAPVLKLEIEAVNVPVWQDGRWRSFPFGDFGADSHADWIVGHVVAPGLRRRIAVDARAEDAGAWYAPDIDKRRLDRLAEIFVAWARREFAA